MLESIGKPIIIATYPRSGTHLTIDLLRKQFQECKSWKFLGETKNNLYLDIDPILMSPPLSERDRKLALHCLSRSQRPLVKTHGSIPWLQSYNGWVEELVNGSDIFYVFRDGRKSLCSLHVFMKNYDPAARCSISEFVRQEVNGVSRPRIWANHVLNWIDRPNVRALKFEDIIKNPRQAITDIGQILGLTPLYVEPILPTSVKSRWQGLLATFTQTQPESTNHTPEEKPAKWTEEWTYEDRKFFHEQAGDLLIRLGYESSDRWTREDNCHSKP